MEDNGKINEAWQRVRLYLPNMMGLYNTYHPQTLTEWQNIVNQNVDMGAITETLTEITDSTPEDAETWVNERVIIDTYQGGKMQDKARNIIEENGYSVIIPTEDEDKKGVDLIAHKGKDKINIQIKPRSFFMCRSRVCKCKQNILRNKCKANKILLMTYDNGKFDKSEKNTYLDNIDNLIKRWQK